MTMLYKYLRTKRHHALRRVGARPVNEELIVSDGEVPFDIRELFNQGAYKVTIDYPEYELIYERLYPDDDSSKKAA